MNQLFDEGTKTAFGYSLDKDPLAGFKEAAHNAQTRLALEYASILLTQFTDKIEELERELKSVKEIAKAKTVSPAPRKAPAKKATTAKAPAKKA